jgi:hypothetical protein
MRCRAHIEDYVCVLFHKSFVSQRLRRASPGLNEPAGVCDLQITVDLLYKGSRKRGSRLWVWGTGKEASVYGNRVAVTNVQGVRVVTVVANGETQGGQID